MSETRTAVATKDHRGSDADVCRANGWVVGTRLVGDEGYGPTIIELSAIGERKILAKRLAHAGRAVKPEEGDWVLWCRDWREYTDDVPRPVPVGTEVTVMARRSECEPMEPFAGLVHEGPDHSGLYKVVIPDEAKFVWTRDLKLVASPSPGLSERDEEREVSETRGRSGTYARCGERWPCVSRRLLGERNHRDHRCQQSAGHEGPHRCKFCGARDLSEEGK